MSGEERTRGERRAIPDGGERLREEDLASAIEQELDHLVTPVRGVPVDDVSSAGRLRILQEARRKAPPRSRPDAARIATRKRQEQTAWRIARTAELDAEGLAKHGLRPNARQIAAQIATEEGRAGDPFTKGAVKRWRASVRRGINT